ncbi:MAG: alpha/beta hydrolase [Gemmatimonadaceae bacterium]|nr:alpha/beta hydrolase [Gemmatimonadaceae bacterium]
MSGSLLLAVTFGAATLVAACGVALVVYVAHRFTTPKRVSVPSLSHVSAERVEFPARHDRLRLAAWYCPAPQANGVVILVHGRDACRGVELRNSSDTIVERLTAAGLSVLLLDLRGHGDSAPSRLTFGRLEQRDVLGAVDYVLRRGYRRGAVGVLGASMGGASAIAAAVAEPAIGALVTDSAYADLGDLLRCQFTRLTRLPTALLGSALLAARMLTGVDLVHDAPVHLMVGMRGRPTLVIHAAGDPFVPVRHARELAIAGGTTLWVTESDRHLGSFASGVVEYADVVVHFLVRHLLAPAIESARERASPDPLQHAGASA